MSTAHQNPEPTVAAESPASTAGPIRRVGRTLGLQGRLVLVFMLLLTGGLGASCWLFVSRSSTQLNDLMGEQARQMASALALMSEQPVRTRATAELERTARDLIKSRNILFVAFLDSEFSVLVLSSRDLDFRLDTARALSGATQSLMQVCRRQSPLFGEYLEVTAPVIGTAAQSHNEPASAGLQGYVVVGVSQTREVAQLNRINYLIIGVACLIAILGLPIASLLVHRVFSPIRQLVDATQKIIAGDLDTRVALDRPDVIGVLARSFNEMVLWVRKQQQALAAANGQLAQINRELEIKVEQRTAQLEMANKRLSGEIAEKEDFLRAVSHDLNAPLRNIDGMASMLLMKYQDKLDEDVIHRLERIKKNVEAETDLISELLELSRIKTRRQKMEPVELSALVDEVAGLFENDLRSRGITLIKESPLPVIHCERARMRQVFQNLIDNAIKYMGDQPKREIRIGCQIRLTEAEFWVTDTGIGISADDIDKVFYVFRRGKDAAVQNVSGKGVGLASVKSIIETYSGKIWVESTKGKGSTFRFTMNGKYVPVGTSASHKPLVDVA